VSVVCSKTDWLATVNKLDKEKVGASGFSLFPLPPAASGGIDATGLVDGVS